MELFSDEDLISIFTFLNLIHNNSEYKHYTSQFLEIFDVNINCKISKNYNLGLRINKLCKNNKNFLRIIILLLYNNMNISLSKLEERFCEYKVNQTSNQNDINRVLNININNIQINNINNNNNQNNIINIPNNNIFNRFEVNLNNRFRNRFIMRRRNNSELSNIDKLTKLEESFCDVGIQFLKLIHFYQISSDIKELYDFNTFENKILINLLLSLYNIIFSTNNIKKIEITNLSYKIMLSEVNKFYNVIISNIIKQKNEDILKEISKQRKILHFKEILQVLQLFNPVKDEKDNRYKYFKHFIEKLEKLVPEEEVKEKIDIDKGMTKSGTKIENNLCCICADSAIDTHLIPCDHSLCKNCLFQCISENKACPFCRVEIKGIKEDPNFKIINY